MKNQTNLFAAATAAFLAALAAVAIAAARGAAAPEPARRGADDAALAEQLRFLARRSIQGDAEATFEFARRVEFGIGTEPDPGEAAHWYGIAEEQGYRLPDDVVFRLFM